MSDEILAVGPPPLSAVAADCAIAVIDFMAAVVRQVDLIDVTPAVRQAWRAHLAVHYQILPLPYRLWYANAPGTLATIQTQWPLLPPMEREMYRQMWAMQLPEMLAFVNPILQAGSHLPIAMDPAPPPAANPEPPHQPQQRRHQPQPQPQAHVDPAALLAQKAQSTQSFINFSNQSAFNTINLMRAFNQQPPLRRY